MRLLAYATLQFATAILWDPLRASLAAAALVSLFLNADILWIVLVGTIISIILFITFLLGKAKIKKLMKNRSMKLN